MTLTGPRRAAASGTATSRLVLLHGYGANGEDLIGLADALAPHLPDTEFLAPDAPEPCRVNPAGLQWFPIPYMDGASEQEAALSFMASAKLVHGLLDDLGPPERTALLGFSQGCMMSLEVGLRRAAGPAAILGYSGRLIGRERLSEVTSRPPVFLSHGDQDPVVPFDSMAEAAAALEGAGVPVKTHRAQGMPHAISPEGLSLGLTVLQAAFA